METLVDSFNNLIDFFSTDSETSFFAWIAAKIVIWWIEIKIFSITFAWSIAVTILDLSDLSGLISSHYNSLHPQTIQLLTFFRFPEALNIILQAKLARFVLDLF